MKITFVVILSLVLFGCNKSEFLFTEISNEIGLNYQYPGNDHQDVGAGVIVLDVNNDGWEDIFQAAGIFKSKLWINDKGIFKDKTKEYNLDILDSIFVFGGTSGDFDNDGFTDLFIANLGIKVQRGDGKRPVLLKNIEGKYFEKMEIAVFPENGNFHGCSWGDINNDGFIDLYLPNYTKNMMVKHERIGRKVYSSYHPNCMDNYLFVNKNGILFEDMTQFYEVNNIGCGLSGCFTDFDNDNDMDLMLLNDFGVWTNKGNRLFKNNIEENKFEDISHQIGFYKEIYGMGIGPGDVNNDGVLDYYLTNVGPNRLMQNQIDTMINIAPKLRVQDGYINKDSVDTINKIDSFDAIRDLSPEQGYSNNYNISTSWSGLFLDINNDEWQDLYVTKGYLEMFLKVLILDENNVYINRKSTFEDLTNISGANDPTSQRGAATFDFDHDGDLDIVTGTIKMTRGEFGKTDQKVKVFRNNNQSGNNWIRIKLVGGDGVNHDCLGCSVTLSSDGENKSIREVDGGSGHSSQSSKILHFGMGKSKYARDIEIQWLGGETQKIDKLKTNKVYRIEYNQGITILK